MVEFDAHKYDRALAEVVHGVPDLPNRLQLER